MSFVKRGETVCCGAEIVTAPAKYYREAAPELERRLPPKADRDRIMIRQEGRCFYCGMLLGEVRLRNGRPVTLRVNWDHRMPYVFNQNNHAENFVAACQVCNTIKSDKVFRDIEEARTFIALRRRSKGYDF